MITINNINNYKETLIRSLKRGEAHVYYFEYKNKPTIKGFYVLEDNSRTYISICAISSILDEKTYEKLQSKYFDVDSKLQKQFFLMEANKISICKKIDMNLKSLFRIIAQNNKKGTPRKHISIDGERVNIQIQTKTLNDNYFEET